MEKLADILSSAPYLKKVNIIEQRSSRKVKVAIKYASEEGIGSIQLLDKKTNEIIVRRETNKTEA